MPSKAYRIVNEVGKGAKTTQSMVFLTSLSSRLLKATVGQ
jgi:hypothetical protein